MEGSIDVEGSRGVEASISVEVSIGPPMWRLSIGPLVVEASMAPWVG